MKTFISTVLVIGLVGIASFTFANETPTTLEKAEKSSQMASGEMESLEFSGMVIETENNFSLMTSDTSYKLKGEALDAHVGKKVKVNGTILKGETVDTIIVAQIEEIE